MQRPMLKNPTFVFAFLLSTLYLTGHLFYTGYVNSFSLTVRELPIPIYTTYFYGFIAAVNISHEIIFNTFIGKILYVIIMISLLVTGACVVFSYVIARRPKLQAALIQKSEKLHRVYRRSYLAFIAEEKKLSSKNSFIALLLCVLYIGVLVLCQQSRDAGIALAHDQVLAFNSSSPHIRHLALHASTQSLQGFTIACSGARCAYYIPDSQQVLILNNQDLKSISSHTPTLQNPHQQADILEAN